MTENSTPDNAPFQVGDKVYLDGETGPLYVIKVEGYLVTCSWRTKRDLYYITGTFPSAVLRKAKLKRLTQASKVNQTRQPEDPHDYNPYDRPDPDFGMAASAFRRHFGEESTSNPDVTENPQSDPQNP